MEGNRSVIILAGGKGLRAGGDLPKQFQLIAGKPMLMRTIEIFWRFDNSIHIVLALPPSYQILWKALCEQYHFSIPFIIADGGETRFHSVKNGLTKISDDDIVAIHDAARPFVSLSVIDGCYRMAADLQCGVIPVTDEKNSIRLTTENGTKSLDRNRIKIVQTPQVFPAKLIKKAYQADYNPLFTDDASVAEQAAIPICITKGNEENIKLTTSFDMQMAELYAQKQYRSKR